MALADQLANAQAPTAGTPCSVCRVLAELEPTDRDALLVALGTPERRGLPATVIYDALVADGHKVGRQTINRHRAGKCRGGNR